jgi:hypothetical protein
MSSDKWVRSIKDNPAGKVVADDDGNRWQWDGADDTSRLLRKLNNDELAIEQTDIVPGRIALPPAEGRSKPGAPAPQRGNRRDKRSERGGFNPYDHPVKPRR